MPFNIRTRFSDKITYVLLALVLFISFISCISIYAWGYLSISEYWEMSKTCLGDEDFKCLLKANAEWGSMWEMFLAITGTNLSIIGVLAGFLLVTNYNSIKRISD